MTSLETALELAVERLEHSLPRLRAHCAEGLLPHVTDNGRWRLVSPLGAEAGALTGLPWTGGFVAGQLWLADLHDDAAAVTELLTPRAAQANTHDLGFLFWPSAVLGYVATAEEHYRELALEAARSLTARRLPAGVLQVTGALDDPLARGRTIADTLPNLLLLWWAERQGLAEAGDAARAHVQRARQTYFRDDGSTYQAVRYDDDGSALARETINGWSAESTWARGQAWAIHGLVSAYRATSDPELLETLERAIAMFVGRLPEDGVPLWDFDAPPDGPRDASAAAIVASALLDLGRRDDALGLLHTIVERCQNRRDSDGLLLHCCYRYVTNDALDCACVWGDFFFLDALVHAVAPARRLDPLA
jgi:unsaturated chondroitin disaccharide hydrolase